MRTLEMQKALRAAGFDPGPLDGIPGRLTIRAVKAFQAQRHLEVDGIVGSRTSAMLFPKSTEQEAVKSPHLPWFEEAWRLKGLREGAGAKDNKTILDWADDLDLHYALDDIPWCGLFVGHCIAATLPDELLPNNPLSARSWQKFGVPCLPTLGCVLVFWRESRKGFKGHVGFYAGADAETFTVLGGNQGDSVSLARVLKVRLLGARWPKTVPLGFLTSAQGIRGALSTNEA